VCVCVLVVSYMNLMIKVNCTLYMDMYGVHVHYTWTCAEYMYGPARYVCVRVCVWWVCMYVCVCV
jgi:hypothetical protein